MSPLPQERPAALNSSFTGALIKWGARANTALYRVTNGRVGGSWRIGAGFHKPAPVCLLTTIGRVSGKPRTAPLLFLRDGDAIVLVASQGGRDSDPLWYRNLLADPHVCIQIADRQQNMLARNATEAQRSELWPRLVELYADFENYQRWTERTIPVVICTPADANASEGPPAPSE